MRDVLTAILLVSGGFFAFIAALGVLRMPDLLIRMHASTKAGTLGAGLILAAAAVHSADLGTALRALAAIAFLLLTAPVAAHMIGRAAYRTGVELWRGTRLDELAGAAKEAETPPPADGAGPPSEGA